MKGARAPLFFIIAILAVFVIVLGWSKGDSTLASTSETQSSPKRVMNGYLPLESFKEQFNEVSPLNIRKMQQLQDDSVITSYLYSFNSTLALSVLQENSSQSIIKAILVTTLNSENHPYFDSLIYACNPRLTSEERSSIINRLIETYEKKDNDATVIDSQIMFKLQAYGPYVKLSAETIIS